MSEYLKISEEIRALGAEAEREIRPYFSRIEEICDRNTEKVLAAFAKNRVSDNLFAGTTGYGYDDYGRDTLDKIYADIFGTEAALVRIGFVNGTHALSCAIFSAVKTGDTVLSVTGPAYDTLQNTITGDYCGSMKSYGIGYKQVDLKDGVPDLPAIREAARDENVKLVFIQRSRGYTQRNAFDLATIQKVADTARRANPNAVIFVDNCYGEFTQTAEPVSFGADIMAGSFIKNPGGGITPTGGYIAGRRDLVEKCSHRFTAPGIGGDLGCTQDSLRDTFLGFYYAPGVVCEALKTAIYAQCLLELAGVNPVPRYTADHNDIVTCFDSGSAAALTGFCAGIQHNSPVDSFASPEPADEPGYTDKVVMASGSFTEGSTIEISCDGPLRAPYTCYLQGGVNFTAGRAAVLNAVQNAFFAE